MKTKITYALQWMGLFFLSLSVFSLSGCKLIFEPPQDAVDRFFQAVVETDWTEIKGMLEGAENADKMLTDMRKLAAFLNSSLYKGITKYWHVDNITEAGDYVIIEMTWDVPNQKKRMRRKTRASKKLQKVPLTLTMQRRKLRWYIVEINPKEMAKLLKIMNKSRESL